MRRYREELPDAGMNQTAVGKRDEESCPVTETAKVRLEKMMSNKVVSLGLWGCGRRSNRLVDAVMASGKVRVGCCYDIDPVASADTSAKYGASVADSVDELLEDSHAEAILIALYPGAHAKALTKAMPSGKPIYIEKPIATTYEDYCRLAAVAEVPHAKVHVGLSHRYYPVFRTLTELVRKGQVGQLTGIMYNWIAKFSLDAIEAFRNGAKDWHFMDDTGGELVQHYCHAFDWLRTLGGEFVDIGAVQNHLFDTDLPLENTWDISLRYQSGALANFHASLRNPRNAGLGWIEGSEGALEWEWNMSSRIRFFRNTHLKTKGVDIPVPPEDGTCIADGLLDFINGMDDPESPGVSVEDGLWASLIPLLARRSAESGCRIKLPESPFHCECLTTAFA